MCGGCGEGVCREWAAAVGTERRGCVQGQRERVESEQGGGWEHGKSPPPRADRQATHLLGGWREREGGGLCVGCVACGGYGARVVFTFVNAYGCAVYKCNYV